MKLFSGDEIDIVFLPEWTRQLQVGAMELHQHLETLGILVRFSGERKPARKQILLGRGWDGGADEAASTLSRQGVLLRDLGGGHLSLNGSSRRGVLNAVYVFLEEQVGVLWLNPSETSWPEKREWDFGGLDYRFDPPFTVRSVCNQGSMDTAWASRNRLNLFVDQTIGDDPRLMDAAIYAGKHCHNVYKLLSLGYYGLREDPLTPYENPELIRELHRLHPEYFALINGERLAYLAGDNADVSDQTGNPSLTHPDIPELMIKGGKLLLEHHPRASYLSLSLRDNYHYCEEALAAPGGIGGAVSRLVNRFAEGIAESHPGILIDFLAYHGTQKPIPGLRFHPSVSVRYCPIRVSQAHAFNETEHNLRGGLNFETPVSMARPLEQIAEWKKIAERVVVWYYTLNLPYFHPQPSLRGHGKTFQLLDELGVSGCYIEDNKPMEQNVFNDLRGYLLAKLLWNPRFDVEAGERAFIRRYYGAAAKAVSAYIELLHREEVWDWEAWPNADGGSHWDRETLDASWRWYGEEPGADFPKRHFYTLYHTRPPLKPVFFEEGWPLVKEAFSLAGEDETVLRRLEELKLSFYYGVLSHPPGMPDLEAEAQVWFPSRYEEILHRYRHADFHGLDRIGLQWPQGSRVVECNGTLPVAGGC